MAARKRVLEAAAELFSKRGFYQASMASIATEADVAVGTLYNLFASKEDLYREFLCDRIRNATERLVEAAAEGRSARERLERHIAAKLRLFQEESELIRGYFAEQAGTRWFPGAALEEEARALVRDLLGHVAEILAEGVEAGEFAPTDTVAASVALGAVTSEVFLLHLEDPRRYPEERVLELALHFTFSGIEGGRE